MDNLEEVLDSIEENEDKLSNWEREFIDDVQGWLADGRTLTERQLEIIKEIHTKVS